jgi:DNA-binding MarR family transcriptional regulator
MFHQAVAERLGLHPTDLKCLDLAASEEPLTAGRLAELAGLTTAAITSVLDRLEKTGFVRRERDLNDRRKVIVRPLPDRWAEVAALFKPLDSATRKLLGSYSLREQALIRDFAERMERVLGRETARLIPGASGSPTDRRSA